MSRQIFASELIALMMKATTLNENESISVTAGDLELSSRGDNVVLRSKDIIGSSNQASIPQVEISKETLTDLVRLLPALCQVADTEPENDAILMVSKNTYRELSPAKTDALLRDHKICEAFKAGDLTKTAVAKQFGVSEKTVRRALKKAA